MIPDIILIIIIGYVIGSIPIAYIVMRFADGRDLRAIGTGNVTSTAVMVHAGRFPGTISLIGEILKAFLCLFVAYFVRAETWVYLLMVISAAVGQIWSIWLRGAGGRGQTIFATGFIVLCPIPFLLAVVAFAISVLATKRSYMSNQLYHVATPFCLTMAAFANPHLSIFGLGECSWGYVVVGVIFCALFFLKQSRDTDDIVQAQAWGSYSR
jgi:glycerol-3-phosphate acyltransferase PlsY